MAKTIKQWSDGSISVAVEAGKDDMNKEGTHVHVYKRGRRTETRIPGRNRDLDSTDFDTAERLFYSNYNEIDRLCYEVKIGKHDR